MFGIGTIDLKVAVVDSDCYAQNAIRAYCAWDRRTRVTLCENALSQLNDKLHTLSPAERPDVLIIDAKHLGGAQQLEAAIRQLRQRIPKIMVLCLAQFADLNLIYAAAAASARAYLLKSDVRIHIAWAICQAYMLREQDFLISEGVLPARQRLSHPRLQGATLLAKKRSYIGLTPRMRAAIELYAIEGMSHRLVANEMNIEESTASGYIKDAKQILESYRDDIGAYPLDMSPKEIAFMRITALDI